MLKQLRDSNSFLSRVAALTSGTVLAQVIAVLTAPIVTRLYTPEEMGVLASFTAIVSILGIVAAGKYDLAIVLPEESDDAIRVAAVGFLFAVGVSLIVGMAFGTFGGLLSPLLGLENVPSVWTLAIAPMVFLIGLEQILQRLHIRAQQFRALATTQVAQQTGAASIKIAFGALRGGVVGLFLGVLAGHLIRSGGLLPGAWRSYDLRRNLFSRAALKRLAARYKKFPLITSWAGLLNTASSQLPVILFASLFSPAVAGYYALSHRILMMPMSLIGRNIGTVYYERAAKARNSPEELGRITLTLYRRLLLVGAVMMSFVTFYGDLLFPFVFGANWLEAGKYAQWISLWIVFQLAVSPLSTLYSIQERNTEAFFWQATLFLSRAVPILLLSAAANVQPIEIIAVYSSLGALWYAVFAMRNLGIAGVSIKKFFRAVLFTLTPVYILQGALRFLIGVL